MSRELQALCFLAGANSIFVGARLLTTANPEMDEDARLFADLGLRPMAPPAQDRPPSPPLIPAEAGPQAFATAPVPAE